MSGATKVERVDHAMELSLLGEDAERLIAQLTPEEQDLFWQLAAEIRKDGDSEYAHELWKVDYVRPPPSILEFIDDEFWMSAVTRKNEKENNPGVFPAWREVLLRDFDLDSRIHNVVLTGSLGGGKSWTAMLILLYRITLSRLLRNPPGFYGLSKGSEIYFTILSISKGVVEETVFATIKNFMANSPYFREVCRFDPGRKYKSMQIPLGNSIFITGGSKSWHIIGRNAMGVAMDEGNFRLEANPDKRAYDLFNDIRIRIKNRFQQSSGFLPAISLLASSAADESSVTERIIGEIESNPSDTTQRVYRFASYDVRPEVADKLSGTRFKVAYGLRSIEPVVLQGDYAKDGQPLTPNPEAPPPGARTVLVPVEYRTEFARNVRTSLQSLAGISTGGNFRLFGDTLDLEKAAITAKETGLVNPCKVEIIPLSDEDTQNVWDFLDHTRFLARDSSRIIPKRDALAKRFIHIDLAKTAVAGLAVSHITGKKKVPNKVDPIGQLFDHYDMVVEYDFILAFCPGKSKPISIPKILAFLYWLRDVCHYEIEIITADQFQSLGLLELLERAKFKVKNLSVDKTKTPYENLRAAFQEERVVWFRHSIAMTEAENLLDGEKVDHPPQGSKDVMDAVCGSYFNALTFGDPGQEAGFGREPSIYTNLDRNTQRDSQMLQGIVDIRKHERPLKEFSS